MADSEQLAFNEPHAPHANAIEAFNAVLPTIKAEIIKSRHHWDQHEPRMWSRASGITDHDLTDFKVEESLVEVRSAPTSYGTVILGKIKLRAIKDEEGEGFIHVRIHDPPNRGTSDVIFHSLFTDEIRSQKGSPPTAYRAIQTADKALEFFNE